MLTTGSTHAEPTLRELVRHRAELQGYVMTELSQCVAVDPRREPAPLPRLHTLAPSKRTLPFEG